MSLLQPVYIRDGHDNFFTPIRLVLATMVLVGHSFCAALGGSDFEPQIFFEFTASYIAVNAFFIVSGFLVTRSLIYKKSLSSYFSARILRIMPALAVHVLVAMLVIGPFVTALSFSEYFQSKDVWLQPAKVLSFYETDLRLPGIFPNNPEPSNGSATLWTLRYEMLAYFGTALLFLVGLLRKKWMLVAQFFAMCALYSIAHRTGSFESLPATLQSLLRFGVCYSLGAAIYALKDDLPYRLYLIPLMGLVAFVTHGFFEFEIIFTIFLGYTVFWLAYVKAPKLDALKNFDDVSYGIYIYHWILLQTVVMALPDQNPLVYCLITLAITVPVSWASWHFVEAPALKYKTGFANLLARLWPSHAAKTPVSDMA